MEKRKILFHINSLGNGGAERVVSVLSDCLILDGYEVVIVTLWRAEEEYRLDDKIVRINLGDKKTEKITGRIKRAVNRFADLRRIIKKETPDIVISFCNKANFRCAFAMAGIKTPLLISVRNDPRIDYAPYKFAAWWMEKKAAGCVFQTPDAQEFFHNRLKEKSRIIWNPVDSKYFASDSERKKGNFIAAVGRISFQKNHMLLLKAFYRIKDKFPETELRIYGEDCEEAAREALDQYIKEQGLESRVKFMGQCSELENELKEALLFVLPSDYEGMPNALIEAMVLGLPVIATDCPCGGPAMLIEDQASGILVPVGDEHGMAEGMEYLLKNRDAAEKMGKNAKKIIEKVSPHRIYEEWKNYMEELISNRKVMR